MATFALIPGAGGMAWYWSQVAPLLQGAGHEAIAVDLPGDDPHAGLAAYADLVVSAIGNRSDVILVAQSLGGFTAARVCTRVRARTLVFVNAMIPNPGESPGAWFANTGAEDARKATAIERGYSPQFSVETYFLADVPPDVLRTGPHPPRQEADVVFGESCDFAEWPDIPIQVLSGEDDRFFPLEFQRRVARERLGRPVTRVLGGHLCALSHPSSVARQLLACAAGPDDE